MNNKTNLELHRFEGGYAIKNSENGKWINLESGHFSYGDEPQSLTDYEPDVYTSEVGMENIPENPKELAVALARLAIERIKRLEMWENPQFEETAQVLNLYIL